MDSSLCRIYCAHYVRSRACVEAEGSRDARYLTRREHKPNAEQRVLLEHEQPRNEYRRLQERREAHAYDLLHPLYECVYTSARYAEHVQTADCDLDEQYAAAFEVCEEHLYYGIRHHDDADDHHDGACYCFKAGDGFQNKVGDSFDFFIFLNDICRDLSDGCPVAGHAGGELGLQGDSELVQFDRHNGEQARRHEALDGIEGNCADVAFASGVVYTALAPRDDEADDVQSPRKVVEKLYNALHPAHLEQLRAHAAHLGEEVSEEAYDLAVEPVKYLIQYLRRDKIPYKY